MSKVFGVVKGTGQNGDAKGDADEAEGGADGQGGLVIRNRRRAGRGGGSQNGEMDPPPSGGVRGGAKSEMTTQPTRGTNYVRGRRHQFRVADDDDLGGPAPGNRVRKVMGYSWKRKKFGKN